jgi:hypothetical protein|tara:strand:- start:124 stop:420 length:297 start_codon:yes stop_codon:yes gene_type:complete
MKKTLSIFCFLVLSEFSFAEDSKICEIEIGKNNFQGIEVCAPDDVLIIYAGSRSGREIIARTVAKLCKVDTVRTIGDFVPNIHVCVYRGKELEIRNES